MFKDDSVIKYDKEYKRAMNFLCSYTMGGKNKNDDAPDSLAMLIEMREETVGFKPEIFQRRF